MMIQRYRHHIATPGENHWGKSPSDMVVDENGDYVLYKDYSEAIVERNDALNELKTLLDAYEQAVREREELRAIANAAIAWVHSGESDVPSEPFVDCGTPDCKSCELVKVVYEYERISEERCDVSKLD